jgi:glycosyltransferase involved in cell wall biosynthesis
MQPFRIAIILPALNEKLTVGKVVREFSSVLPEAAIYVVDNGSTDDTAEVARLAIAQAGCAGGIIVERRRGKGNALRKAFHVIDAEIYVICDSDSTYLPADLPRLLKPVLDGEADIVVGDRLSNNVYDRQNIRPLHGLGNRLVRKLINLLFGVDLRDVMSGYRVLSRRFVRNFPILSHGFEIETEMTLHAVDRRFAITELPIGYCARPAGSFSKLSTFGDGFLVISTIFRIFKDYHPLVFFSWLSAIFTLAGLGFGLPVVVEFTHTGLVPRFPTAIFATGLVLVGLIFFAIALILDTVTNINREQSEARLQQHDRDG